MFDLEFRQVGAYARSDDSYARLLDELFRRGLAQIDPALRANILEYFSGPGVPRFNRKETKLWGKRWRALRALKALPDAAEPMARQTIPFRPSFWILGEV
jgi:hypothetical protein